MYRRNNGAEIAPCIIAKIRSALGLTDYQPINRKKCSQVYWEDAIDSFALAVGFNDVNVVNEVKGNRLDYL